VNLALNARRTVTRRREQPLPMDEDLDALLDDAHPETALARAESAARMRGLLDELPADKRAVVRLVHQEDMAIRDVAAKLGIPEGTVKSRLYHARKLLARHWHELEDEP
jgi:RNA polymerase sigma-70 factor (ECF subfamily)